MLTTDLYDALTMSPELRKAHQDNDWAVMEAYGFAEKVRGKYKQFVKRKASAWRS